MDLSQSLAGSFAARYPDEAAAALETRPADEIARVLQGLPLRTAAAVVKRISPGVSAHSLEQLDAETAAGILAELETDEALPLLRRLSREVRDAILRAMPAAQADVLKAVIRYPAGTAGALMDPLVTALPADMEADEALKAIRGEAEHAHDILYVVDRENHLAGTLDLRHLLLAQPKDRLETIMEAVRHRLSPSADRHAVVRHAGWLDGHSLPVVDGNDRLHLTLKDQGGFWSATEVVAEESLGYGDYILTTVGRLDLIDPQVVLGIFLWEYGPCYDYAYLWWNPYNEIDIEYSRWGFAGNEIGQFVAQPWDYPGNVERFDAIFGGDEVVSHAMRWSADRVEYRVWRGGPDDESEANMIHSWTYTGPHISRPEQPRMHLNLWKLEGTPAVDQEVVFQDFVYLPEGVTAAGENSHGGLPAAAAGRLYPAAPNPFNPQTTIRYELVRDAFAELKIYDIHGRCVRTLVDAHLAAGAYRVTWDGRDERGRRLASGVYLVQLRGTDYVDTQRVAIVK